MLEKLCPPATCTAEALAVVVAFPSWPTELSPQQSPALLLVTPHTNTSPTLTLVQLRLSATGAGVAPFQQYKLSVTLTPHSCGVFTPALNIPNFTPPVTRTGTELVSTVG
jgi:hypothetical protein